MTDFARDHPIWPKKVITLVITFMTKGQVRPSTGIMKQGEQAIKIQAFLEQKPQSVIDLSMSNLWVECYLGKRRGPQKPESGTMGVPLGSSDARNLRKVFCLALFT